jgi:eukaryotic-like serine/threonine-protein kinase
MIDWPALAERRILSEVIGSGSRDDDETVAVTGPGSADASGSHDSSTLPHAGRPLGRYLVIETLGRGGMGVVLRAYDPKLQREVALKIVRTLSLDESAQARLVREARAMARLAHPNVVSVYDVELDAKEVDAGVVLVMEYVPGSTLRQWLAETSRSPTEIINAFVAAGRGLAAAHAEGLLHRDFKLDNVLVGSDDRVRVTDFGLARATGASDESDDRVSSDRVASGGRVDDELTTVGTMLGTPRYMAPEQHDANALDSRIDQYAFCVALWRALTGSWPFEGNGTALLGAKRKGPPSWPNDAPVPRYVADAIRRGLATDPDDRWPDLPTLLAELRRDPSRRGRRALATGLLVLAGLGAWGWQQWQRARTLAACGEEATRMDAVWNPDRASSITAAFEAASNSSGTDAWERLQERIDVHAAEWKQARSDNCEAATVTRTRSPAIAEASRECLDEQLDHVDALLDRLEDPDQSAIFRAAVAMTSVPPVRTCTEEIRLRYRAEPPDAAIREEVRALRSRLSRARVTSVAGRHETALEQCEAILDEAKALTWSPLVAEAKLARGAVVRELGRNDEAREDLEGAFFMASTAGHDHRAMLAAAELIFLVGFELAQHETGLHWGRVARMFASRLGLSDAYDMATVLNNVGNVYEAKGEWTRALEMHSEALALRERALGPDHPLVARSLSNLGDVHLARGEPTAARKLQERALEINKKVLGEAHPEIAQSYNNLAAALGMSGRHDRALDMFESAKAIMEQVYGPEHPKLAMTLGNIGAVHVMLEQYDEALPLLERAREIFEGTLGPDHPYTATSSETIGLVHFYQEDYARAMEYHESVLAARRRALDPGHPQLANSLENLARALEKTGAHEHAREHYEQALAIRESADGPPVKLAYARFSLARLLQEMGRERARAIQLATDARDAFRTLSEKTPEEHAEALATIDAWLDARSHRVTR